MTSGDLTFDLTKNWTKSFVIIFDALSIAAYRVYRVVASCNIHPSHLSLSLPLSRVGGAAAAHPMLIGRYSVSPYPLS